MITWFLFVWSVIKVTLNVLTDTIKLLYRFFVWLVQKIIWLIQELIIFLGPVYNSIRGKINEKELYRVITLAASVGTTFWGAVEYVYNHVHEFVNDPITVAQINTFVAVAQKNWLFVTVPLVVFIGDLLRRKFLHGTELIKDESV